MCDSGISASDLEMFIKRLADTFRDMGSLEDIEKWLESQPCVISVSTADYLIKTAPPQKEISVTFKVDDGSFITKVIDVILYPDQRLGLAGVHEP